MLRPLPMVRGARLKVQYVTQVRPTHRTNAIKTCYCGSLVSPLSPIILMPDESSPLSSNRARGTYARPRAACFCIALHACYTALFVHRVCLPIVANAPLPSPLPMPSTIPRRPLLYYVSIDMLTFTRRICAGSSARFVRTGRSPPHLFESSSRPIHRVATAAMHLQRLVPRSVSSKYPKGAGLKCKSPCGNAKLSLKLGASRGMSEPRPPMPSVVRGR